MNCVESFADPLCPVVTTVGMRRGGGEIERIFLAVNTEIVVDDEDVGAARFKAAMTGAAVCGALHVPAHNYLEIDVADDLRPTMTMAHDAVTVVVGVAPKRPIGIDRSLVEGLMAALCAAGNQKRLTACRRVHKPHEDAWSVGLLTIVDADGLFSLYKDDQKVGSPQDADARDAIIKELTPDSTSRKPWVETISVGHSDPETILSLVRTLLALRHGFADGKCITGCRLYTQDAIPRWAIASVT